MTHSWEGRHCADISVEVGEESGGHETVMTGEEYSDENLFADYENEKESVLLNGSMIDAKLVNAYKTEAVKDKKTKNSVSKAIPLKRGDLDLAANRQMDISLTEVGEKSINEMILNRSNNKKGKFARYDDFEQRPRTAQCPHLGHTLHNCNKDHFVGGNIHNNDEKRRAR